MEALVGKLVKSTAGHDKDRIFFIYKEEGEYVYLVDGKYKTLERPKKKKKKHVEAVTVQRYSLEEKLLAGEKITNEEIKHFIRCFKREEQVVRR